MVIWLSQEYWEVCYAQADVPSAERQRLLAATEPYVILAVLRAGVPAPDAALPEFATLQEVSEAITVSFIDPELNPEGEHDAYMLEPVTLEAVEENTAVELGDLEMLINAFRPQMAAMLGQAGAIMQILVFENTDGLGTRPLALASGAGELRIVMEAIEGKAIPAATLTVRMPFNSLFVPRQCCGKEMHIAWHYCPFCGEELEAVSLD
jgi:hypothetical protein